MKRRLLLSSRGYEVEWESALFKRDEVYVDGGVLFFHRRRKRNHRLAEEVEGLSEDILEERKKDDLDRVVHSQSETICQRRELVSE